jgi:hypothetical protein
MSELVSVPVITIDKICYQDKRAVRRLVILKRVGKTPIFAECEQCHLKFFTPRDLERDSLGAEERIARQV